MIPKLSAKLLIMSAKRRVTIALIAEEAGVSIPTVSKVINGRPEVAPATRHRVERLLHKHGYQRRISQDETRAGLVDVVFTEMESPWAMEIVRGAEMAAHEAGASVVISVLHTTPDRAATGSSGSPAAGPTAW